MARYLIGALVGGAAGYFIFYRLIGCSSGACPITANPYISTVYGIVLGILLAGTAVAPGRPAAPEESPRLSAGVYQKLTAAEAKARIDSGDGVILVDVRTEEEYRAGHIPGAVLIPNETIADTPPEQLPDLDAEILIYCRSGNRSAQAANKLIALGYTNVYDFGGIIDWPYETVAEE